ncbi:hypothetical protein [Lacticaseibacillus sharpeae]|uniref:hypothetical protein n=1 Tax=Lacticaseibacillus sharpeae TaxID=1626 RepID=UPI000A51C3E0|nr:hypothetical protein [Lacticaseibacillus sharpeae]
MKNYEDQIRELTGKIANLKRECSAEEEALRLRSSQLEKQRQATAVEKERWKAYRQHIDHYDQLERRNGELNNTVERLADKCSKLESSKNSVEETKHSLEQSKRQLEQSNTRLEQSNNKQATKIQQLMTELEESKKSWFSRHFGK